MKTQTTASPALVRFERLVNIALIVVALLFIGTMVKRFYLTPAPSLAATVEPLKVGTKINLPGINWSDNGQTLLIALSTNCHFCTESAPFYQQLVQNLDRKNVQKVVALFPQPVAEGEQYLHKLGVAVDEVRQADVAALGLPGTPTIILVNHEGVVNETWIGKLGVNMQFAVLDRLKANAVDDPSAQARLIDVQALRQALNKNEHLVILDIEDRDAFAREHIPGAKNIPLDELETRIEDELSNTDRVILYGHGDADALSQHALEILIDNGLTRVSVLEGGLQEWKKARNNRASAGGPRQRDVEDSWKSHDRHDDNPRLI